MYLMHFSLQDGIVTIFLAILRHSEVVLAAVK